MCEEPLVATGAWVVDSELPVDNDAVDDAEDDELDDDEGVVAVDAGEVVVVAAVDAFAALAWAANPAKAAVRPTAAAPTQVVSPLTRFRARSREEGVVMAPWSHGHLRNPSEADQLALGIVELAAEPGYALSRGAPNGNDRCPIHNARLQPGYPTQPNHAW